MWHTELSRWESSGSQNSVEGKWNSSNIMYKFGEAEQSGGMLSEDEKHCLGCCNFWLLES